MTPLLVALAGLCAFAFLVHVASIVLVIIRDRRLARRAPAPEPLPAVTILRPVRGIENHIERTLESAFLIDHKDVEILFCVASAEDPVIPVCEAIIARHPGREARILVGDDPIGINPKLNNLVKGWRTARHDHVVMADSNVLMPRDYVRQLFDAFDAGTGLVCSPPIGDAPVGFHAELECAFLNSFQGRWQLCADAVGLGFAQGKTMLWRKSELDAVGGIARLGDEVAEDAASTKLVREGGRKVRLVRRPFVQPLGRRSFLEVWNRQVRWARLRRASFPLFFLPELLAGGAAPMLAAGGLAAAGAVPVVAVPAFAFVWYGAEAGLAAVMGWPRGPRAIATWMVRDALLPVLWCAAISGSGYSWRGNDMNMRRMEMQASAPRGGLAARLRRLRPARAGDSAG
ncbi:ceramide glucosyltransferase [Methylobrevis pamukkalensis]|uniref:Ceramide glucosyltransferase n=1 Tax=Methylobrevis pamukkalensis TaxID=1439726 RepID=A0A1E3H323_9HYPH|nr:ceramide glucosyltransferase [Methylobrevis pamukkalensis]ODN69941.1 hypothetical protein A6302_02767 [Methylobrevis pamukkalensis]